MKSPRKSKRAPAAPRMPSARLLAVLKKVFGLDAFRNGQEEVVQSGPAKSYDSRKYRAQLPAAS